jgi:integrase/recombinase XerD
MRKHQSDGTHAQNNAASDQFGGYRRSFLLHLESLHHAPATIAEYGRCIDALRERMRELNVDADSLNEKNVRQLIRRLQQRVRRKSRTAFAVRRFVQHLVELGVAKPASPVADGSARGRLKQEYEDYLRNQRGLSDRSIYNCWRFADRFLTFRFKSGDDDLSKIVPADIAKFMQHVNAGGKPSRDKTPPTHLRNFFQFLFKNGVTRVNLAPSVPRVAQKYASTLPRYLTSEQVEAVIAAVKVDTPIGRRNYAMVLLLARLGLRATEVIAIQIDDINWRAGELLVRGKGQRHDRLPLPKDVGEALANYIRRDRKTSSRALFVKDRAPRVAFADAKIANLVLKGAFERTGLKPPRRYVGSHILRHSLATTMVRRGASLGEIGEVLRHRAQSSTMIYAKLDVEGLRSVAREWPVAGGAQ